MIFEVALPVPVPKTFDYLPPDHFVTDDPIVGRRVKVLFGPRPLTGVIVSSKKESAAPVSQLKHALSVLDHDPVLDENLLRLGQWLARRYVCSLGEALNFLLPPAAGSDKRNSTSDDIHFYGTDFHAPIEKPEFVLTGEQNAAISTIHDSIYSTGNDAFLLRGVSAAGKTEVYMAAIKDVLAQGKSALYLAPEIGLVNFIAEILKQKFGHEKVCVYHSGRTAAERREDWWRIKRGDIRIVVGARAAALLPMKDLGVIVVDEEHESAWKEDRKPRFHARDVALARSRIENATVVFGSATPSLEIILEAKEGRVRLLEMNERAVRTSTPSVRLIDMKTAKGKGILSYELEKAIGERLQRKEQVVLFINRRGFHRTLRCPNCEWTAKCPDCGVSLVEHKNDSGMTLQCHYCSKNFPIPKMCPECGHKKLSARGTGTERVTDEIKQRFPWANVARWDRDSVSKKGSQEKILQDFKDEKIDVLVGTQLVAQGFHFPKVTLVGVVNADTSLHVPDFRAAEHTFQILMQVAGRAGRDMVAGEVLIQTRHADHAAIRAVATLDFQKFSEDELGFRRDLLYPPFTHLVEVEATAKDTAKTEKQMNQFIDWIMNRTVDEPIGILGPVPSRRKRKGISGQHVLLKVPLASFDQFLTELHSFLVDKSAKFRVNVDPN